jgi:hypothetical protein
LRSGAVCSLVSMRGRTCCRTLARNEIHAALEGHCPLLRCRDALAVHALGTGQADVIGGRTAQVNARVLAFPHHMAVRGLAHPVLAHHLITLMVRDDGQHRSRPCLGICLSSKKIAKTLVVCRPLCYRGGAYHCRSALERAVPVKTTVAYV